MKSVATYLTFDGNAREAMTFYAGCLGADLDVRSVRDSGMAAPPGAEDRTIHARLSRGAVVIMASDTMPGMPFTPGTNFSICLECSDAEEQDRIYAALAEGGRETMLLENTFWGARFGMLTDRFGVNWMLNLEQPKQ